MKINVLSKVLEKIDIEKYNEIKSKYNIHKINTFSDYSMRVIKWRSNEALNMIRGGIDYGIQWRTKQWRHNY